MPVWKDSVSNAWCYYCNPHSAMEHTIECSRIMELIQANHVLSELFLKVVILPQIF